MKELFDAIRAGDADRVSALLDGDPSLAGARDDSGVPALAVARYNGKNDIVQLLLERGAPLDLFLAAMFGNIDSLKERIAADPRAAQAYSSDGWTALHLAAFFNQPEAARVLLDAGADVNARSTNQMNNMALHAAAAGRATDVVRMLLESGASVNARQIGGWTALHSASQSGNAEMARVLIAAGADTRARADNQQTPMDLALTGGHQEVAELLDTFEAGR